ncbi:MAG: thiolase family protein [Rhodospirillaceae bacterium]|nr:thiolase family protein [Rhodospirillaceae bacterium]
MRDKEIAIIAYAELPNQRGSGKRPYEFGAEIMAQLIGRSGIEHSDIDGLAVISPIAEAGNTFYSIAMADTLGLAPRWSQVSDIGGCSPIGNVARAAAAIQSGQCEMVMCIAADASSAGVAGRRLGGFREEFMDPTGFQGPPIAFGVLSHAYDQQYGLSLEALGKLAVTQRNGALVNENAVSSLRKPITVEDYLNSRMIAEPIRLLDCVMRVDGGSGLLVTTADRAKSLGLDNVVYPVAYSELTNFGPDDNTPDITETGFSVVGPEVLEKASMSCSDIDMFQPYDDFLIAIMLQMEQIGFCKRGEGSDFILSNDLSPTGVLPTNTGGGQISCGQPGLGGGGVNLTETVRQLFGEAGERQVPNARTAMVTGIGFIPYLRNWGCSAAMIMER